MTGTMFDVKVDRDDPTLLHEQVAAQIRRAIAEGEAGPASGSRPRATSRQSCGVNTNTVLRRCGSCATRACSSCARATASASPARRSAAPCSRRSHELVALGRRNGYTRAELVRMIETAP